MAVFLSAAPAIAIEPVKGEVSATTEGGYARIIFSLAEDVESDVRAPASGVLVITFKRPVDLSVNKLNVNAPDYVSAARRDPDGRARPRKAGQHRPSSGDPHCR